MNLDQLGRCVSSDGTALLSGAQDSLDKCIIETLTISHLLHPPLLDEAGFVSAARSYVESFAQRSGIEARLDLPEGVERLPELTEIVLFRVLQESLINVHRHSGSSSVEIQLKICQDQALLTVRDFGHGMPSGFQANAAQLGVGLSGMRGRVSDLGGHLGIKSDPHGTTIVANVPLVGTAADLAKTRGRSGKSSAA